MSDYAEDMYRKMEGATLLAVLKNGEYGFAFKTTAGVFAFAVEGDCCSSSWVESIEVVPGACGSVIRKVFQSNLGSEDDDEHDCLRTYNVIVRTNKGDVVVDFRNSSNGYYGGYVVGDKLSPRDMLSVETIAEVEA